MSDLQPMSDAQASEHVFWQYRMHRRRWRRLTGIPVRRFRRSVRFLVKRRGQCKGRHHGFGFGGHRGRRSYVVIKMTYVPTLAPEGREQAVALEKGTVEHAIHAVAADK